MRDVLVLETKPAAPAYGRLPAPALYPMLPIGLKTSRSQSAEILPTHTAQLFKAAVQAAATRLRAGEVVALPTETVYGLAANALDKKAVNKIFEIKGRPEHNPLIVHVAGFEMAKSCITEWPIAAEELARAFWPGPLTLVLPKADVIPDNVTAGGGTVGIRWPSHPFIQAVMKECGFPLAAPSANPSNQISPTNATHVQKSLGEKISLIVDGGQSQVGIESTVVDLSEGRARLLRPGIIHGESLQAALAGSGLKLDISGRSDSGSAPLRSPGRLLRHYSPKAKLRMLAWKDEADLERQIKALGYEFAGVHVITHTVIPHGGFGRVSVIPHDAEAFARALYAELHACDEEGARWIVVEALPEEGMWHAIADRLSRAAASE